MLTLEEIRAHFRRHDPVSSSLGIEVLDVGREYSLVEMPPHGCQLNGMGAVHDGAVFVLADVAFAALSNANGLYCTNAQTSISFVRSGRVGPLRGEARVLRSGKLLSTYEVRVTDAEGGLVAVATITGGFLWGMHSVCGFRIGCSVAGCTQRRRRVPCLSPPCGLFWA